MPTLSTVWTRFFPPKPKFTEKGVPDPQGKVYVVTGSLVLIHLDLKDLANVKAASDSLLAREDKLHMLFNNAGVWSVPPSRRPRRCRATSSLWTSTAWARSYSRNC